VRGFGVTKVFLSALSGKYLVFKTGA